MENSQPPKRRGIVIQQGSTTKVMYPNVEKFARPHEVNDRPMTLNAWTQTTGDDFSLLQADSASIKKDSYEQETNRLLLEKIRVLESTLRQQSDLLSQIHATSARLDLCRRTSSSGSSDNQNSFISDSSAPPQTPTESHILTPPNSVINATQILPTQNAERVNYKIIAEACNNGEPIEIQLTTDDRLSLNSSNDSDRLQICLEEPRCENIKKESVQVLQQESPSHFIKRRKMEALVDEIDWSTHSPAIQQAVYEIKQGTYKLPVIQNIEKPIKTNLNVLQTPKNVNTKNQKVNNTSMANNGNNTPENVMVSIGPNNTRVPAKLFEAINWNSSSLATRKLLVAIFDRETLGTHSMTGKPSPAFRDQQKPQKKMLDPLKIQDIIFAVTHKCAASEKEVRNAITTKCADENKMMKLQKNKRKSHAVDENTDKENVHQL